MGSLGFVRKCIYTWRLTSGRRPDLPPGSAGRTYDEKVKKTVLSLMFSLVCEGGSMGGALQIKSE